MIETEPEKYTPPSIGPEETILKNAKRICDTNYLRSLVSIPGNPFYHQGRPETPYIEEDDEDEDED